VGSTARILRFIEDKVGEAAARGRPQVLRFALGTEAGMAAGIVRRVQEILRASVAAATEVEIVFPVADDAVATTGDPGLAVVPGVAAGEGCSPLGGCATCPYMKMNSFDALVDLLDLLGSGNEVELRRYQPRKYSEVIEGRAVAELGRQPILHMRELQRSGRIPDELLRDARSRVAAASSRG
jgi:quinolinate synthase